jgi:hypothetical protein
MLALLTGSPGVGKTTVATALAARYPMQVETVSFGTLIHQAVNDRHRGELSYAEFRRLAAQLVRQADIEAATDLVIALKSSLGTEWLVVDSHAVAQTSYGWQAYPDKRGHLEVRIMAVEPGVEELVTQAFAVNDRGAQMQPEYGGTVVATARVMAPDVAAMIPQTTPQRTSTCFGEPVRTDPDDTVTSIPPELAALVEEVDAVGWSTGIGGAVPQESRAAHVLC